MIAFAHRDVGTPREYRQALQRDCNGKSPGTIHRRSRVNPVFIVAAFTAALLFDAISSPIGQTIWNALLARLNAVHPFGVGSDTGSPITDTYKPPFLFTGKIERVGIELGPRKLSPEDETKVHEMHTAFAGARD